MRYLWKLIFSLCLTSQVACQPLKTINVNVVGDDGNPIEGAEVVVWFYGYQPEDSKSDEGLTNEEGNFHAQGRPLLGMLARVNKDGYYQTEKDRLPMTEDQNLTLVLRETLNPIPLIVRKVREKVPGIGEFYGYDLKNGDWVKPFGKGMHTDLLFKVMIVKNEEGKFGGKLEVTFLSENEGVFVIDSSNGYLPLSKMKMPNLAPSEAYKQNIKRIEYGYQNVNKPRNTSYFFRTRVNEESNGEFTYHYTKFLDGIKFSMGGGQFLEEPSRSKYPKEYGAIDFVYYFNPQRNDRNLEFDPSSNLIKGLKYGERESQP
ncbi:carboxypeptidase-like regulatory domain-containing protein [Kiritimatiellota bacterium B12222]|nr:carboxypeptidase-like regulatory domain-containing protein [Kiritimatiellota bacterium B12222]